MKSQEALQDAVRTASERGHSQVEGEHLFAALLRQEGGVAGEMLARTGVPAQKLLAEAEWAARPASKVSGAVSGGCRPASSRCSARPRKRRIAFKDEYISAEHFLLAFASEAGGKAGELLRKAGATREALPLRADLHSGGASGSPTRTQRRSTRLSTSIAAT